MTADAGVVASGDDSSAGDGDGDNDGDDTATDI
jgi:hypothetical protein